MQKAVEKNNQYFSKFLCLFVWAFAWLLFSYHGNTISSLFAEERAVGALIASALLISSLVFVSNNKYYTAIAVCLAFWFIAGALAEFNDLDVISLAMQDGNWILFAIGNLVAFMVLSLVRCYKTSWPHEQANGVWLLAMIMWVVGVAVCLGYGFAMGQPYTYVIALGYGVTIKLMATSLYLIERYEPVTFRTQPEEEQEAFRKKMVGEERKAKETLAVMINPEIASPAAELDTENQTIPPVATTETQDKPPETTDTTQNTSNPRTSITRVAVRPSTGRVRQIDSTESFLFGTGQRTPTSPLYKEE